MRKTSTLRLFSSFTLFTDYYKISLLLIFLFPSLKNFAQDQTRDFRPNLASYSPNTAAFLKYGDQPVSKYTGIPGISIPVFTISSDGYKLPIELSYHAGGIKIEEEASWVGLGWSFKLWRADIITEWLLAFIATS